MVKAPPRSVTSDRTLRVRGATFNRMRRAAETNRLKLIDLLDVLVDAWDRLSPEEQRSAITAGAARRG